MRRKGQVVPLWQAWGSWAGMGRLSGKFMVAGCRHEFKAAPVRR